MAWYEGAPGWTPVSALPFIPQASKRTPPPPPSQPQSGGPSETEGRVDQDRPRKNKSTKLFACVCVVTQTCMAVLALLFVLFPNEAFEEMPFWSQTAVWIAIPTSCIGILGIAGLFWQLHYDAWRGLPIRYRTSSPNASAWLLFLPVFNLFWVFRAHLALSKQYGAWADSLALTNPSTKRGAAIMVGVITVLQLFTPSYLWVWIFSIAWCGIIAGYYDGLFKQAATAWASEPENTQTQS